MAFIHFLITISYELGIREWGVSPCSSSLSKNRARHVNGQEQYFLWSVRCSWKFFVFVLIYFMEDTDLNTLNRSLRESLKCVSTTIEAPTSNGFEVRSPKWLLPVALDAYVVSSRCSSLTAAKVYPREKNRRRPAGHVSPIRWYNLVPKTFDYARWQQAARAHQTIFTYYLQNKSFVSSASL